MRENDWLKILAEARNVNTIDEIYGILFLDVAKIKSVIFP